MTVTTSCTAIQSQGSAVEEAVGVGVCGVRFWAFNTVAGQGCRATPPRQADHVCFAGRPMVGFACAASLAAWCRQAACLCCIHSKPGGKRSDSMVLALGCRPLLNNRRKASTHILAVLRQVDGVVKDACRLLVNAVTDIPPCQ